MNRLGDCFECAFWREVPTTGFGLCCRHAPRPKMEAEIALKPEVDQLHSYATWPKTDPFHCCGEWKEKGEDLE